MKGQYLQKAASPSLLHKTPRIRVAFPNIKDNKVLACIPDNMSLNRYTRDDGNGKQEAYIQLQFSGDLKESDKARISDLMLAPALVVMSHDEYEALVGRNITE